MITCEIMGGLGNQLFQVFFIISLAIDNKIDYVFLFKKKVGNRITYWDTFFKGLSKNIVLSLPDIHIRRHEKSFRYETFTIDDINKNYLFTGYFASYMYFEHNANEICKIIKLNDSVIELKKKLDIGNEILENSISLHFRYGDYKRLPKHYILLNSHYYLNSINFIIEKTKKTNYNILYFYEDEDKKQIMTIVNELKNNFENVIFIDSKKQNLRDYEEMLLMSLCSHNIIANSTFSLWGAYFNTNVDKIVTYPDTYAGELLKHINFDDMYPSNWIKISIK